MFAVKVPSFWNASEEIPTISAQDTKSPGAPKAVRFVLFSTFPVAEIAAIF
jgi:hypothetical protein